MPNHPNAQPIQGASDNLTDSYPVPVAPIGPVAIAEPISVEGVTAEGAAATERPVLVGTRDTAGNKRALLSRVSGIPLLVQSVTLVDGVSDAAFNDESGNNRAVLLANMVYDALSGGWDAQRGVVNFTLLALAARTVTTASAAQINRSNGGIWLHLRVTVSPGGGQTLTPSIQLQSGSGGPINVHTFAAVGATGNYYYFVHPGAVNTLALANVFCQSLYLGRDWTAEIAHSGAGSWTYALSGGYIGGG